MNITNDALIKLENVKKIYRLEKVYITALRGISFEIEEGEYVAIVGPSGSGKSTIMNLIGCLDKPTSGRVLIEGKDTKKMSEKKLAEIRRKKIGFVFQQFNLIPRLTAIENVELPMWFSGIGARERRKRAKKLLEAVDLGDRLNHRPGEISGGEQQRVAIARALANNPSIILADEPTGNLDSKSGEEIISLLEELNNEGKTLVVVTHEKHIERRARRVIRIKDGMVEDDSKNNSKKSQL